MHSRRNVSEEGESHCFFFSYGCVVTWALTEAEERALLQTVKRDHSTHALLEDEVDDFQFVCGVNSGRPALHKDVITLSTSDVPEKLAISFALAQSAKLGVFEVAIT